MTLDELYQRAYSEGIEIDDIRMRELEEVCFPEGWIAIDSHKFDTLVELKCTLAHAIGHCETGSFYNIYSPYDIKEKCERKADRRAAEILMPLPDVRRALRRGITEPWMLAELFDVTVTFAETALAIYDEDIRHKHRQIAVGFPQLIRACDLPRPVRPTIPQESYVLENDPFVPPF